MRPKPKRRSTFLEITWKDVRRDPRFAKAFFDVYLKESVPVQTKLLRTLTGISQVELAKKLQMNQAHFSQIEKDGSNHVIRIYNKVAKLLNAKLALIPNDAEVVLRP